MPRNNIYPFFSFYCKYIFVLSHDPQGHTASGCRHILFLHCGTLREMYSSPSAVHVFNTAHAVCGQHFPLSLFFLLLSPVVIFQYLCNLSGLNSHPCVSFGRSNPPDAALCCSNDITVVCLRSELHRWGNVHQGAPAWQFVPCVSQTAPCIQQLLVIPSAVAVLTETPLHLTLWQTGTSSKPNSWVIW